MPHSTTIRFARALALFAAALLLAPIAAADWPPADADARLAALQETLEAKRAEHHVPGMAFVLVHGDDVLVARGFGATDLAGKSPVTATTPFMIGSTTKAFTAALVGMQVDAGKLAWDEPIATYLPYFDPAVRSDDENARVTLRDALSHRSGFSRMGMLLTAEGVTPKEVLQVAATAEPFAAYHSGFNYNNIMYLAAGTAAAQAAGSDYHTLLKKKLFKPLGMKRTWSTHDTAVAPLPPGWAWMPELDKHDPQPVLKIDVAGPAGSIVSNAEDMGRWLAFLLEGGRAGKKRLLKEETLETMWTSNVTIAPNIGYGMGWMVREWEGRRLLEHGGNIHGFGAQVALLPDQDLGFALLTNLSATPLQQESIGVVWEALLGAAAEAPAAGDAAAAEDLSDYLGDFVADFGSFSDADFKVTETDGVLHVDVPGQMNYALKPAGEDGRRPFAITDTVAVSFERSEDGAVNLMRLHQGGLDFELPRRGVEIQPEIDPLELAPYLGTYKSEVFQGDVHVVLKNHRLALDVPNQMAFELHLPDEEGRRYFRIREGTSVTFDLDESGAVASLTLRGGDEVRETMPRTGDPDGEPLPSVEELMAVRASEERLRAWNSIGATRARGTMRMVNAGLSGESTRVADGERMRSDVDFGKFGWMRTYLGPDGGEMETSATPRDAIEGRLLEAMRQGEVALTELDWRETFETVRVLKRDKLDDTPVVLLRLENEQAPAVTAWVDPATGDLLRYDTAMPIPGMGAEIPLTGRYADYREVDGVRLPFRAVIENPESGRTVIEIEAFETGVVVCDATFTLEEDGGCE